jgi:hypothetical protein
VTDKDFEAIARDHCVAEGSGGTHTDGFYDEPGGQCQRCAVRSTKEYLARHGHFDRNL